MSSGKQPVEIELKLTLPGPEAEATIVEHLLATVKEPSYGGPQA